MFRKWRNVKIGKVAPLFLTLLFILLHDQLHDLFLPSEQQISHKTLPLSNDILLLIMPTTVKSKIILKWIFFEGGSTFTQKTRSCNNGRLGRKGSSQRDIFGTRSLWDNYARWSYSGSANPKVLPLTSDNEPISTLP